MRQLLLLITFLGGFTLGQQTYFPPLNGNTWDSLPIAQLGWQQDRVDSLYRFLDAKNSKSFMMLKGGKRVIEQYFDGFVRFGCMRPSSP